MTSSAPLNLEFAQALKEQARAALDDPNLPAHLRAYFQASLRKAQRLLNEHVETHSFNIRL